VQTKTYLIKDGCYDFEKNFAKKFGKNIGFLAKTTKSSKKLIWKNRKNVIITPGNKDIIRQI
jgi:hypothetical protein